MVTRISEFNNASRRTITWLQPWTRTGVLGGTAPGVIEECGGERWMKIPSDVTVESELNLLLWKPCGTLNEKAVNQILAFIREEEAQDKTWERRFVDTTGLMEIDINFHYVFHVAVYRRLSRQGLPQIKTAFFVQNPAFEHYVKLHALLTDHSPLQVKLFKEQNSAAQWLDVPLESLAA